MEEVKVKTEKPSVINCHTHIFTGDHVPPYLAKSILPWPFYYLFPLSGIVRLFRFWYKRPYTWQFTSWYRSLDSSLYRFKMTINRAGVLRAIHALLSIVVSIYVFFIVAEWLSLISSPSEATSNNLEAFQDWLVDHRLLILPVTLTDKLLLILLWLVLFRGGRKLVWVLLRKFWSFLGVLPGPQTIALAKRYLTIGRFAFYNSQARIFGRLRAQYPEGTGFIVLPMDMEYMDAGPLKNGSRYQDQMQALAALKKKARYAPYIYPFVFADPRRLLAEGASHFNYNIINNKVVLNDCFIRQYIEEQRFSGFKIYPALGYYPFDEILLPLWKYAADHGLPILTHCIRGTIYFRGTKEKAWDYHPVMQQAVGGGAYEPLKMFETANKDFINNFTHPLNYLCLLEEELLRRVVAAAKDPRIHELFGYTNEQTKLTHDLSHLKLCFGHFGGDDEWVRFLEGDRDNYSSQLVRYPQNGVSFFKDAAGKPSMGKLEQVWKYADWYTLICSLMLQYDHVYADVSYILHNEKILPLLKQTLANDELKRKVLYGTDFYVVRNHKTEKQMLAEMIGQLSEKEFDQIARTNPRIFLNNKLHGAVPI